MTLPKAKPFAFGFATGAFLSIVWVALRDWLLEASDHVNPPVFMTCFSTTCSLFFFLSFLAMGCLVTDDWFDFVRGVFLGLNPIDVLFAWWVDDMIYVHPYLSFFPCLMVLLSIVIPMDIDNEEEEDQELPAEKQQQQNRKESLEKLV